MTLWKLVMNRELSPESEAPHSFKELYTALIALFIWLTSDRCTETQL